MNEMTMYPYLKLTAETEFVAGIAWRRIPDSAETDGMGAFWTPEDTVEWNSGHDMEATEQMKDTSYLSWTVHPTHRFVPAGDNAECVWCACHPYNDDAKKPCPDNRGGG